jgi:hypothetical protein
MVAYAYRMPAGIPGEVTRYSVGTTIEQQLVDPNNPPLSYGIPVVIDAVTFGARGLVAADVLGFNVPYGCIVRPYPIQPSSALNYGASPVGSPGIPPTQGIVDILKRGYMSVAVAFAGPGPVKGGQVYIWTAASAGPQIQGGFTSDGPSANVIAAPAYFTGPTDSAGNGEIAWNI